MPRNRKYFVHNSVVLVTSRTEEGLPFVPSYLMEFFLWGILARAQEMYNVKCNHFIFLANHFHMLLTVVDPEHVSPFIGYIKAELSHVVNLLLGRRKKTIWSSGYDSPIVLTQDKVEYYTRYIYLNPIRANLVHSIDEYPGVSSWQMFKSGVYTKQCKTINRDQIKPLASPVLSIREQKELVEYYQGISKHSATFELDPFSCFGCFEYLTNQRKAEISEGVLTAILQEQRTLVAQFREQRRFPIGATELRRQSMLKEYQPKKFSRRMICISSCIELRCRFIEHFKTLCELAAEVYHRWKLGDYQAKMPPGFLSPRYPTLVSALELV